jgi:hypothetical protein
VQAFAEELQVPVRPDEMKVRQQAFDEFSGHIANSV